MYHMSDHFKQYRCSRRGDTDLNETQHKHSKSTYAATNHRLPLIASQILSLRESAQRITTDLPDCDTEEIDDNEGSLSGDQPSDYASPYDIAVLRQALDDISDIVNTLPNDHVIEAILSNIPADDPRPIWSVVRSVRITHDSLGILRGSWSTASLAKLCMLQSLFAVVSRALIRSVTKPTERCDMGLCTQYYL